MDFLYFQEEIKEKKWRMDKRRKVTETKKEKQAKLNRGRKKINLMKVNLREKSRS